MVKTRSQTENITIKKEGEDCKPSLRLESVRSTRASARIAKRKSPTINNRPISVQQVKLEGDTDTKALLKSTSNPSKSGKNQKISQEQIHQLIDYIVNHNMSVNKASRKVKMAQSTGARYYNVYKNNPERKMPFVRKQQSKTFYTQEQIENLIKYINSKKMTVKEASAKANMAYRSGSYYYNKYLEDPEHNIPVPQLHQSYTQEQRETLLGYIINDKMSILAASKKAKMNHVTGYRQYREYFKQQYPDIATPSHIVTHKFYTQEQIKQVISYIVDDEMTISAASRKANISNNSAGKYYRQYLKDNNIEQPVPKKSVHTR